MMEPVTLASSFAAIVGLLGTYKAERRSANDAKSSKFLEWLESRGFDELASSIKGSAEATVSIESLVRESSEVVLARLDRINRMLASLAAHVDGVAPIALALRPRDRLSGHAVGLLQELEAAEARAFVVSTARDREPMLLTMSGRIEYGDPRFLDDDLATLIEMGLLRLDQTAKGKPRYVFTRAASEFVRDLSKNDHST